MTDRARRAVGATLGLALVAVASTLAPTSTLAEAEQAQRMGRWTLKTGVDGRDPYCTVEVVQDGRLFGYQVPRRGRPIFGFSDPAWCWLPGSLHAATISVDDATAWTGRAPAAQEWLVLPVPAAAAGDPARALAAGRRITLAIEGRSITFDLAGFLEAADAQRACLAAFTDKP